MPKRQKDKNKQGNIKKDNELSSNVSITQWSLNYKKTEITTEWNLSLLPLEKK